MAAQQWQIAKSLGPPKSIQSSCTCKVPVKRLSSLIHSHVLMTTVASGVYQKHPVVQAEHPATTHMDLA